MDDFKKSCRKFFTASDLNVNCVRVKPKTKRQLKSIARHKARRKIKDKLNHSLD